MKRKLATNSKRMGAGAFAYVYQSKKHRDRVVKVGYCNDGDVYDHPHTDPYLMYLKKVLKNRTNPYFPKVHSIKIYKYVYHRKSLDDYHEDTHYYFVIELEKLAGFYGLSTGDRKRAMYRHFPKHTTGAFRENLFDRCAKEYDRFLKKAIMIIRKVGGDGQTYSEDFHTGNFMWRVVKNRQPQLVITDPIS